MFIWLVVIIIVIVIVIIITATEKQTTLGPAPFEPDILDFVVMHLGRDQKEWATESWPVH